MKSYLPITEIRIVLLFVSVTAALQCMDENNNAVDWFVVYKIPTIKHHGKLVRSGVAYRFMTSEDSNSWKLSNVSINSTSSVIGRTLNSLYNKSEKFMYVLYNDQPPNRKSNPKKGHNKGVVLANDEGGFWLVHSVPHFPQMGTNYTYPRTAAVFGQSFLCMSLDLNNLDKVGKQLQYNQPEIYGANILENLKSSLPELSKAANNITNTNPPWYNILNITSRKGVSFTSFAKSKEFNKDLYEDLVAPFIESDLYVETWPNGPGKLKSNCSKKFKVNNILDISFVSDNLTFTTTNDHSKWAVSPPTAQKNWICIGDINRSEHQKERGGGTACLNNKQLVINYQKIIASIENCPKTNINC